MTSLVWIWQSGCLRGYDGEKQRHMQEPGMGLSIRHRRIKSAYFYMFLTMVSLAVIGIVDWHWANRMSLMPFYTIPVIIATVMVGRSTGIVVSVLSTLVLLLADLGDGSIVYHYSFTPYWNATVRLTFFLLIVGAIALRKALRKEKLRCRLDPLTGVPNRRAFYELARKEIARCKRYGRSISLVFFDFNGFKQINDRFGHRTGDKVLHDVGKSIKENVRDEDIAARWGGDEFVVLLPETDYTGAVRFVNRLNKSFVKIAEQEVKGVSTSFGIKSYAKAPFSIDEMVKSADELMYSAKRTGLLHESKIAQEKNRLTTV